MSLHLYMTLFFNCFPARQRKKLCCTEILHLKKAAKWLAETLCQQCQLHKLSVQLSENILECNLCQFCLFWCYCMIFILLFFAHIWYERHKPIYILWNLFHEKNNNVGNVLEINVNKSFSLFNILIRWMAEFCKSVFYQRLPKIKKEKYC